MKKLAALLSNCPRHLVYAVSKRLKVHEMEELVKRWPGSRQMMKDYWTTDDPDVTTDGNHLREHVKHQWLTKSPRIKSTMLTLVPLPKELHLQTLWCFEVIHLDAVGRAFQVESASLGRFLLLTDADMSPASMKAIPVGAGERQHFDSNYVYVASQSFGYQIQSVFDRSSGKRLKNMSGLSIQTPLTLDAGKVMLFTTIMSNMTKLWKVGDDKRWTNVYEKPLCCVGNTEMVTVDDSPHVYFLCVNCFLVTKIDIDSKKVIWHLQLPDPITPVFDINFHVQQGILQISTSGQRNSSMFVDTESKTVIPFAVDRDLQTTEVFITRDRIVLIDVVHEEDQLKMLIYSRFKGMTRDIRIPKRFRVISHISILLESVILIFPSRIHHPIHEDMAIVAVDLDAADPVESEQQIRVPNGPWRLLPKGEGVLSSGTSGKRLEVTEVVFESPKEVRSKFTREDVGQVLELCVRKIDVNRIKSDYKRLLQ